MSEAIKWIFEKPTSRSIYENNEVYDKILTHFINNNYPYEVITYIPFSEEKIVVDRDAIAYGSLNFLSKVNCKYFCNLKNLKCSSYYNYLGKYLVNDNYVMLTLKELLRNKNFISNIFGCDIFVRPDSAEKPFKGFCTNIEDIEANVEGQLLYSKDDVINELVVISSFKKIIDEYRFVIYKNKEVLYSCQYVLNSIKVKNISVDKTSEVFLYVKDVIKNNAYYPDDIYVMDIARIKNTPHNERIGILELNGFSAAGLYSVIGVEELFNKINFLLE